MLYWFNFIVALFSCIQGPHVLHIWWPFKGLLKNITTFLFLEILMINITLFCFCYWSQTGCTRLCLLSSYKTTKNNVIPFLLTKATNCLTVGPCSMHQNDHASLFLWNHSGLCWMWISFIRLGNVGKRDSRKKTIAVLGMSRNPFFNIYLC